MDVLKMDFEQKQEILAHVEEKNDGWPSLWRREVTFNARGEGWGRKQPTEDVQQWKQ